MSTTPTISGEQFERYGQLVVSNGTEGIDLSNLRFRFQVQASDAETPNTLVARVYNPADETKTRVISEFNMVTLTAGFAYGVKGTIFQGEIKQVYHGRERNVDKFLEIRAADGDLAYNKSVINQTFPAGTTDAQTLAALAKSMGVGVAPTANGFLTTGGILPRGKTYWGMARAHVSELARKNNCRWSIQNGQLTLVPNTGFLPGQAVEINSATGMIGTPEQTDNGIIIRCLLNPLIQVGQAVKINNRDINQYGKSQSNFPGLFGFPAYRSQFYPATVADDGLYRVLVAEHYGDTRGEGDDWFTELTCLDIDRSNANQGKPSVLPQG